MMTTILVSLIALVTMGMCVLWFYIVRLVFRTTGRQIKTSFNKTWRYGAWAMVGLVALVLVGVFAFGVAHALSTIHGTLILIFFMLLFGGVGRTVINHHS